MRKLAMDMNLELVIFNGAIEEPGFWDGVKIEYAGENLFDNIGSVVYPAFLENQSRILLKALAAGIPVITTPACGLPPMENLNLVPIGDYDGLKEKVEGFLYQTR